MPAPLAKGHSASSAASFVPRSPRTPPHRPNRPLATGLIIAASVIVAAGIAIYESPQVRQWVDQSRRKIAVALNSLGEDARPRRPSEHSDAHDARARREELVRQNRNDLIQKARQEGIAVDLDELAKIGSESVELAERRSRSDRTKSFDQLVGSDGMLKASGKDTSNTGLKKRGAAGFAAGSAAAAVMMNPFSDDNVLFDVGDNDDEAPSPQPFTYTENDTRESSATIKPETMADLAPIVIANDAVVHAVPFTDYTPETQIETQIETQQPSQPPYSEVADEAETAAQSFYSVTSSASATQEAPSQPQAFEDDSTADHHSTGTLTPRSQHSRSNSHSSSSIHSLVSYPAADVDMLSMQNDTDHDARSDAFSEAGWTDAGVSESGDDLRPGIMTPNSWTDVGSDDESEWGGLAGQGQGHVSQLHQ